MPPPILPGQGPYVKLLPLSGWRVAVVLYDRFECGVGLLQNSHVSNGGQGGNAATDATRNADIEIADMASYTDADVVSGARTDSK